MSPKRKEVVIYSDGACQGNPGPGGWAALLIFKQLQKELWGNEKKTTNQRMEMRGALEALKALKEPCRVKLYSDSAYLINAFRRGWLQRWQLNGWKTIKKKPVENQDLWQELLRLCRHHDVHWFKVKGHSGNEYNNRCDYLAKKAISFSKKG